MVSTTLLSVLATILLVVCAAPTDSVNLPVLDIHTLVNGFGAAPLPRGAQRYWIDSQTIYFDLSVVSFPLDHLWEIGVQNEGVHSFASGCSYSVGWVDASKALNNPAAVRKNSVRSGGMGAATRDPTALQNGATTSSHLLFLRGTEFPGSGIARNTATHIFFSFEHCYVDRYIVRSQFNKWNGDAYLMDWGVAPLSGISWSKNDRRFIASTARWQNGNGGSIISSSRDNTITKPGFGWWGGEFYFDYSSFVSGTGAVTNPVLELNGWNNLQNLNTAASSTVFPFAAVQFGFCRSGNLNGIICDFPVPGTPQCRASTNNATVAPNCPYGNGAAFFAAIQKQDGGHNLFSKFYFDINRSRSADNFDCAVVPFTTRAFRTSTEFLCFSPYDGSTLALPATFTNVTSEYGSRTSASLPSFGTTANWPTFQSRPTTTEMVLRISAVPPSPATALFSPNWVFPPFAKLWRTRAVTDSSASPILINFLESTSAYNTQSCSVDKQRTNANYGTLGSYSVGDSLSQLYCSSTTEFPSVSFQFPTVVDKWSNPFFVLSDLGSSRFREDNGYSVSSSTVTGSLFFHRVTSGSIGTGTDGDSSSYPMSFQISPSDKEFIDSRTVITIKKEGTQMNLNGWVQVHSGLPNVCATKPCQHGTCYNGYTSGHFVCVCDAGWAGMTCNEDVKACASDGSSCLNGGTCVDNIGKDGFTCQCTQHWTGLRCEAAKDNCPVRDSTGASVCLNGGRCISSAATNSFTCDCTGTNWQGQWCERPRPTIATCLLDPLICGTPAQGTCVAGTTGYSCVCTANWAGPNCNVPKVCDPNPCNGGHCSAIGGVAVCTCSSLFYGERCEKAIVDFRKDDCRYSATPCSTHSTCTANATGAWTCKCNAYWTGPYCDVHVACSPNPCRNNGVCLVDSSVPDHQKEAICQCTGNWFGDMCAESLADYFADCRFSALPCQHNGVCSEVTNNTNPTGPSRYQCIHCDPGWFGDFCENADVCVSNGPCVNGGVCSRGADAKAHCICTGEWTGPTCAINKDTWIIQKFNTFTNDCRFSSLHCQNGGECVQRADGSFACVCGVSSHWTGETCEVPKVCIPNPCMNGGMCSLFNGAANCHCPGDFVGSHCETALTTFFAYDCRLKPCENGGSCTSDGRCVCDTTKWVGQWCELPVVCQGHNCNGGECVAINGKAACICPGTAFGDRCQFAFSHHLADCRTNPCMNGGTCALFGDRDEYVCNCATSTDGGSWTGARCEISRHCSPNPCLNGGVCSEWNGDFACVCAAEWGGRTCNIKLSTRIDAINQQLTAQAQTAISQELSGGIGNPLTNGQDNINRADTAVNTIQGQVAALNKQISSLDAVNKKTSADIEVVYSNFARKTETDEIHSLLNELLSPASSVVYSFSLFITLFFFLMN